jgi:imidazole glycerol-phosphate synthase subunit HisH
MSAKIGIIDYGLGNLHSVEKACVSIGASVQLVDSGDAVSDYSHLILPGVGAFADGMKGLKERKLINPLKHAVQEGKPLLGICLGAQLLLSRSSEFGMHQGLNFIPGIVAPIPDLNVKVPHVGWQKVEYGSAKHWKNSVLESSPHKFWGYFIHSFHAHPENEEHLLAICNYGGHTITAAVQRENVMGLQFHPEKSGRLGLGILKKFIED